MTAAEARKVATDQNTNEINSQWSTIIDMIKQEAGKGKYEVWVYNTPILSVVREKLLTNGYKVGPTQTEQNETMTKIVW